MLLQKFHSLALSMSPRCLAPIFFAIIFANIVIYLLWTSPASRVPVRRRSNLDDGEYHADSHRKIKGVYIRSLDMAQSYQQSIPHWKGVWIPNRSIQVMSVIEDIYQRPEIKIVLLSFLKHSSNRKFYCCMHWSDDLREFVQVPARLDYIDLRYMAELQGAAFECSVRPSEMNGSHRVKYVSFASESCMDNRTPPMTVMTPERRTFEFAICTKVVYDYLDPRRLLEWFTFMEVMGASKILTFHNNVHNDTMTVLNYFAKTGLLELIEFDPRNRGGVSVKYTARNGQTHQAHHDKTLAARDCQYRLSGYDYVMTIDFDEFPVPRRPFGTISFLLEELARNFSDAAAFRMEPILLPPDWLSRKEPVLYHWQFTRGVHIRPYGNKWVYAPPFTWMASTHNVVPKDGYKTYVVPQEHLHFLHFRSCKLEWHSVNCSSLYQRLAQDEDSLLRFADRVLSKLQRHPLEKLIPLSTSFDYTSKVRKDPRGRGKLFEKTLLFDT
ncbi:hypothetical protein RRG08_014577 [Elysia crispata]|uniref:Glycosyltransferase family 92 protein n=1 Tax=Elysia crispata TaxID=231223 RepID=A0AAE1D1C0_9GAST|nr:hypothetical protein RRG08_014577 [Elysia crispata]